MTWLDLLSISSPPPFFFFFFFWISSLFFSLLFFIRSHSLSSFPLILAFIAPYTSRTRNFALFHLL
jgi:hypothetical protein